MKNVQLARWALSGLFLFLAPAVVAGVQDLPNAKTVVELHLKSLGDRSALEGIKSMETVATMTMPGPAGEMKASMTILQKEGNSVSTITIDQLGEMQQGNKEDIFWSMNPFMGPQLMEKSDLGPQAEEMGNPVPALKWLDRLDNIKVVGVEEVDGKSCYKLEFLENGVTTVRFFDKDSGEITKLVATNKSPMGEVEVAIYPSEYKSVSGIMLPHRQVTSMGAQGEVVLEITSIKINSDIPDSKFELPADVKKLVEKKKADNK